MNLFENDNEGVFFMQTQTLHDGGVVYLIPNGNFLNICIGKDLDAQAALSKDDVLKLASELSKFAKNMKQR